MHRVKHYILDLTGLILMLASPLFGGLPGPGGIPIFLAGLGLLAVNHEWAKSWLVKFKKKSFDLMSFVFVENRYWQLFYDVVMVLSAVAAGYLLSKYDSFVVVTAALLLLLFTLFIFLGNRERLQRILRKTKK